MEQIQSLTVVVGAPSRLIREQLRGLITDLVENYRVVAEAGSPEKTIAAAHQHGPQLVLMMTRSDEDPVALVKAVRNSPTTRTTLVVLLPDHPYETEERAPGTLVVLPRSRYTSRAMRKRIARAFHKST